MEPRAGTHMEPDSGRHLMVSTPGLCGVLRNGEQKKRNGEKAGAREGLDRTNDPRTCHLTLGKKASSKARVNSSLSRVMGVSLLISSCPGFSSSPRNSRSCLSSYPLLSLILQLQPYLGPGNETLTLTHQL